MTDNHSDTSEESRGRRLSDVSNIATQTFQFDLSELQRQSKRREYRMSKLSPREMTSSAIATYPCLPSHQSWDSALNEVLGILRIQYRSDDDVILFLNDPDKVRQLQYSTSARMEWNRRVIKEEMDSGVHCPTRSRRIAKEVAIDYIRRFLDGEEERMDLMKKIQMLQREKEDNLTRVMELERDIKCLSEENMKQADENSRLSDEVHTMRKEIEILRCENAKIREDKGVSKEENDRVRGENAKLREENKKLRIENQDLRNENGALRSENQKVRHDNNKLRDEASDMRNENMKLRGENQAVRDENQEVRCENLKLRDNNNSLRGENERFRTTNETLHSENRRVIRENQELHAREDEMRMMVNVLQSLLAGKVGAGAHQYTGGDGRADEDSC